MSKKTNNFSPKVRERVVRLVLDQDCEHHFRWVECANKDRLLRPIGNIPPAEPEERYYALLDDTPIAA